MATPLISHPFRLLPNGSVAMRDESSQEYLAERIALILTTRPGERVLVPSFGTNDTAFEGLPTAALQLQIDVFGVPVKIKSVTRKIINDEKIDYIVDFQPLGEV